MAEDNDDSQKTEDPTGKRLQEARDKGNIPVSRETAIWVLMLGMVLTLTVFMPYMTRHMFPSMQGIFEKAGEVEITMDSFGAVMGEIVGSFAFPLIGMLAVLGLIAAVGWIVQIGPLFNVSLLNPKWERLNPIEGFKRLFSANAMFELLKSIVKIAIIGIVAYNFLKPAFLRMEEYTGLDNVGIVATTYDITTRMFFGILLTFTAVALVDLLYQRFTHFKKLRMTRTEVKEEFRQTEGDPHVKGRLRQIRVEKARKRMMASVPKADVVITNPTHYALALKYEAGVTMAPVLLAKGQDHIAMKIRELAEEHKIPIVSNPPLARALYASVEIDEEVPPQHYRAVAEVISYVFRLRKPKRS